MNSFTRPLLVLVLATVLSGCWNQGNCQENFGSISFGKQFKDLKEALNANALSPEEYDLAKKQLLELTTMCNGKSDVE